MTKITHVSRLTREQLEYLKENTQDIVKTEMSLGMGRMIAEKFPTYATEHLGGLQYELSVYVYSPEEIKKIIILLKGLSSGKESTQDIADFILEILTRNIL